MSALGIQDALAVALGALALGWLVVRKLRSARHAHEGCEDCPAAHASTPPTNERMPQLLVLIGEPPAAANPDRTLPPGR